MHEVSIVEALLEQVRTELQAYPDTPVRTIRVRVGALRQVVPEMLTFCYDAAVRGTQLEGCRLDIEQLPAEARCRRCSLTFAVAEDWLVCPRCGKAETDLLHGDELDLMSLELAKAS